MRKEAPLCYASGMAIAIDDLLSVQEAAATAGLSRQRIQALISQGRIKTIFDGVHHIPRENLEEFMAQDRPTRGGRSTQQFQDYLSTAEVASVLGLTQGRVKTLVAEHLKDKDRGLESVLITGRRYVHVDEVARYQSVPHPGGRPRKPTTNEERQERRRAAARAASARRRAAAKAATKAATPEPPAKPARRSRRASA